MKQAEWFGFSLSCDHDLELLPVVDFSFSYRCLSCGGLLRMIWTEEIAGINMDMMKDYASTRLEMSSQMEIPD